MSFRDFSSYIFDFDRLDGKMPDAGAQNKYYNKWMKRYAGAFRGEDGRMAAIEWDLRCRKALREIFSSATFYVEAKKGLEMRCFSSYYFCLYYSLFHAIYSGIFLDAGYGIGKLLNVTHRNIINMFLRSFGSSKHDIMPNDIGALFTGLKYRREYYSYVTPFNNLFDYEEDLEQLKNVLLDCYQLTSFHSLMVEKSYRKNNGKIVRLADENELYEFESLFQNLFSKKDKQGRPHLDPSCEFLRGDLLRDGFLPEYIALDLEHQFDEFHTYDGFYDGESGESALRILDIWSFVYDALQL